MIDNDNNDKLVFIIDSLIHSFIDSFIHSFIHHILDCSILFYSIKLNIQNNKITKIIIHL